MVDTIMTIWFIMLGCFVLFLLIRNEVAYKNHMKILFAICDYRMKCIINNEHPMLSCSDMESYEKTMFRLFDFGYDRILSKDKFEIIKPYIK